MRSRFIVLALLGSTILATAAPQSARSAPRPSGGPPMLPDLTPQQDALRASYVSQENGRLLLRFATVLVNVGDGPIEVRGQRKRGKMVASQAVYSRGVKKPVTRPFGEFIFHEEHGHWHLLQVAEYRVTDLNGTVLRTSGKVSFCMADTAVIDADLPGAPGKRQYAFCETRRFAKSLKSGISVGWCDIYAAHLPGQWVDVTGLPPGQYRLECVVDPDGVLQEKTQSNNTAWAPVSL